MCRFYPILIPRRVPVLLELMTSCSHLREQAVGNDICKSGKISDTLGFCIAKEDTRCLKDEEGV